MATTKKKNTDMAIDWLHQLAKQSDNGWDSFTRITAAQVLKDDEVRRRLTRLFSELEISLEHQLAKEKLVKFLTDCIYWAGFVFDDVQSGHFSNKDTRTQRKDDLKVLKTDIKALQKKLKDLAAPLNTAISLEYLNARHAAGNPSGFSKLRRPSLRLGRKMFDMNLTLQHLLGVLQDEVQEVSEDILRSISRTRQTKGKDPIAAATVKAIGRAIEELAAEVPLSIKGKNSLTTALASAILIAFNLPRSLSESTVRSQLKKL